MKFTHFLITRFNVPVHNWDKDKSGVTTLSEAWMDHRMDLFRKYCVPTIAGQSEKNFKWIIYCDVNSSERDIENIHKSVLSVPEASIRFVSDFDHLLTDLKLLMQNVSTPYVITSRVDNDDGLGRQYIYQVQKHFVGKDKTIINLEGGILYDTENRILTEIKHGRRNHYGSLVEEIFPPENLVTVVGYPHDRPPESYPIVEVYQPYSWLKIIHSRNLSSRTNGIPVLPAKVLAHYDIAKNNITISYKNTWKYMANRFLKIVQRNLLPGNT